MRFPLSLLALLAGTLAAAPVPKDFKKPIFALFGSMGQMKIKELQSRVGQEVGVSPWIEVTQERIDGFAKAIGDFQWIHVDRERAKSSPFGGTIAHGFLTLSLLSHLLGSTIDVSRMKMGVNYGLNRVRFTDAVPAGSRIRGRFVLAKFDNIKGGTQLTWGVTVEREGSDKPACVAEWVTRQYS